MKVAILLPTLGRAVQLRERMLDLLQQPTPPGVELAVVLSIVESDTATIDTAVALTREYNNVFFTIRAPGTTAVQGWNLAYQFAQRYFMADWFVLGADDIVWHNGWLDAAVAAITPETDVIGLNDLHTNLEQYAAHYMVSAAFCRDQLAGNIAPPVYLSWWFDREVCDIARRAGVYTPAWEAVAEHRHPDWHNAAMDETYKAAWPKHDIDRATYLARGGKV